MESDLTYTAFVGSDRLAAGNREKVLTALKRQFDQDPGGVVLIFEDATGKQVDFDLRGTLAEVLARYAPVRTRTGPGRPKLGVSSREVSLLPRHWEWLEEQPAGASAAIRRLVDEARKQNPGERQARLTVQAADRFMTTMAGNLPNYEEATRALYARNRSQLKRLVRDWPRDIRLHVQRLVQNVL